MVLARRTDSGHEVPELMCPEGFNELGSSSGFFGKWTTTLLAPHDETSAGEKRIRKNTMCVPSKARSLLFLGSVTRFQGDWDQQTNSFNSEVVFVLDVSPRTRVPRIAAVLEQMRQAGVVQEWCRGFAEHADGHARRRGKPTMTSVAKHVAHGLAVGLEKQIVRFCRAGDR